MISNPATFFINGSEHKEFEYEGGSKLFHFSPNDNGIEQSMCFNVVFFANDEAHAKDILKRMLEFAIDCKIEYLRHKQGSSCVHREEFMNDAINSKSNYVRYLKAIDEIKITLAPTNQFYKVGWASNDSL